MSKIVKSADALSGLAAEDLADVLRESHKYSTQTVADALNALAAKDIGLFCEEAAVLVEETYTEGEEQRQEVVVAAIDLLAQRGELAVKTLRQLIEDGDDQIRQAAEAGIRKYRIYSLYNYIHTDEKIRLGDVSLEDRQELADRVFKLYLEKAAAAHQPVTVLRDWDEVVRLSESGELFDEDAYFLYVNEAGRVPLLNHILAKLLDTTEGRILGKLRMVDMDRLEEAEVSENVLPVDEAEPSEGALPVDEAETGTD